MSYVKQNNPFYKKYAITEVLLLINEFQSKGEHINKSVLYRKAKTNITHVTTNIAVNKSLEFGLINIEKDGREGIITLTEKGKQIIQKLKTIEEILLSSFNLPSSNI